MLRSSLLQLTRRISQFEEARTDVPAFDSCPGSSTYLQLMRALCCRTERGEEARGGSHCRWPEADHLDGKLLSSRALGPVQVCWKAVFNGA